MVTIVGKMWHLSVHVRQLCLCFQIVYIFINNSCKGFHMVLDLIKMNCCWGGPKDQVILLDLWHYRKLHIWVIFHKLPSTVGGRKRFGYAKWHVDCPFGKDKDSHQLDRVNFSHPQVPIIAIEPNMVEDVCIQQLPFNSSNLLYFVSRGGLELKENICVDG
jgi:hypothetical protein